LDGERIVKASIGRTGRNHGGKVAMFHADFGGDAKRILAALSRALAIVEFDQNGKVLTANENFCQMLGYTLPEIVGKPHSIFVSRQAAASPEHRALWTKLARGEFDAGDHQRVGKDGKQIWVQATRTPILDRSGKLLKVVEVAAEITPAKRLAIENAAKLDAVSRAQCVAEYSPEATLLDVNENFLKTLGYTRESVLGAHHRTFVDAAYAQSEDYREFWRRLNQGERIVKRYKRAGVEGKEIWIEASYNPICDLDNRVTKIVNYFSDVTDSVGAVAQIAVGLGRLAKGDLSQRIEAKFIPSLEQIRVDFNASLAALEGSMAAIGGKTELMRSGASEISTAADDLSRRTEQQASSLQETAAALEQVTATVQKTAEGAKHARDVVTTAKVDADKSGEVVREATKAMTGIDKSSKQISQIIGVIDEIAFQTNLLALNAGVEAARAGDAGRGFAVVAAEVRALAQRSAEAAKEIKGLISASATQVGQGVLLVTQTGEALGRIVARVMEINTIVTDIAASAQEQATGLQQINIAVNQMDQVTQQNAAMVEQTTAASHALADETEALGRLVEHYRFRAPVEDRLRKAWQKTAPHALRDASRQTAPAPASRVAPQAHRRPAAKVAAGGSGSRARIDDNDWQDF
jgi:methyl-accepting chemotaxis protein